MGVRGWELGARGWIVGPALPDGDFAAKGSGAGRSFRPSRMGRRPHNLRPAEPDLQILDFHEAVLNLHETILDTHEATLRFHETVLDSHETLLGFHETVLNLHETVLNLHETVLDSHEATLGFHETVLDSHETVLNFPPRALTAPPPAFARSRVVIGSKSPFDSLRSLRAGPFDSLRSLRAGPFDSLRSLRAGGIGVRKASLYSPTLLANPSPPHPLTSSSPPRANTDRSDITAGCISSAIL